MIRLSRLFVLTAALLSLTIWVFYARHWWIMAGGESSVYSLMSLRILEGKHYLMTAGQAHGGTPLAYLRASLFRIFGVSHFIGGLVNGLTIALAVALWTRFSIRWSGKKLTGAVTGLLMAVGSGQFARLAQIDYFALSLITGGLLLNLVEFMTRQERVSRLDAFCFGLLSGMTWHVWPLSFLYVIGASVIFLSSISAVRQRLYIPSRRELMNGKINRLLTATIVVCGFLSLMAFFTYDRFLEVNAESNARLMLILMVATVIKHRWRPALESATNFVLLALGTLLGAGPTLYFRALSPEKADHPRGLVRWQDIVDMLHAMPERIGANFSQAAPLTLGLGAAAAAVLILALGFFSSDRQKRYRAVLIMVLLLFASWAFLHTDVYFDQRRFFILFFPLYLAIGLAAGSSRFRKTILALALVPLVLGIYDFRINYDKPNVFAESAVIEQIKSLSTRWHTSQVQAPLGLNYDLTWASLGEIKVGASASDERFPEFQAAHRHAQRLILVQTGLPAESNGLLEDIPLRHGFHVMVLEKAPGTR